MQYLLKLEQTIQRAKKSESEIIGQTREASYVTEWELSYHETYHELTCEHLSFSETDLHHELGGNVCQALNECSNRVITFIDQRGNPYLTAKFAKLHHFTTGQCVPEETAAQILICFQQGESEYIDFRNRRLINKSEKLSDRIKMRKLPSFSSDIM